MFKQAFNPIVEFVAFLKSLVMSSVQIWLRHDVAFKSAALTFYMVFAAIPLLSLLITISTIIVNEQFIAGEVNGYIATVFNDPVAARLQDFVNSLVGSDYSVTLSVGGAILLLYGSTTYFARLNQMVREVATNKNEGNDLTTNIYRRLRSLSYSAFIFIFILVLSATQTIFSSLSNWLFAGQMEIFILSAELVGLIVGILMLAGLLTVYYRSVLDNLVSRRSSFAASLLVALSVYVINIFLSQMLNFSAAYHDYGIFSAMLSAIIWLFLLNTVLLCGAGLAATPNFAKATRGQVGIMTPFSNSSQKSSSELINSQS